MGALAKLEQATRIDPSWAQAWNDLGVVQRRQGDPPATLRSFEKAVTADPAFAKIASACT